MAARKKQKIVQAGSVVRFAARLREVRLSRGMTQADLAHTAGVSEAYVGRLERAAGEPGIGLVDRLARALGVTAAELLPADADPDEVAVLREQAQALFDGILGAAGRDTLLVLNPLLRLVADQMRSAAGAGPGRGRHP